jgi:hypothetical protein
MTKEINAITRTLRVRLFRLNSFKTNMKILQAYKVHGKIFLPKIIRINGVPHKIFNPRNVYPNQVAWKAAYGYQDLSNDERIRLTNIIDDFTFIIKLGTSAHNYASTFNLQTGSSTIATTLRNYPIIKTTKKLNLFEKAYSTIVTQELLL